MMPEEVAFISAGVDCAAWLFRAVDDRLAGPDGKPIAVMAHGLGGTKDSGLAPFAEALGGAGVDVFAFDYRGFGASDGRPRQLVSMQAQLADYRAAMAAAAALPGVDGRRLVLWGVSVSGGTVLTAAAGREDVVAVISLTPLVDGRAAAKHALATHSATSLVRAGAIGLRGRLAAITGRETVMMAVVGRPGELAAMSLPGLYEDYLSIAGPTWRNEIAATITLELGNHRPGKQARHLRCPLLVQIADFDRSAPPHAAAKAAFQGRAEVRHYPCDHFDVHVGKRWHGAAVAHQVAFLARVLAPARNDDRVLDV
ncbi:MAG: lysophospholipase [Actinomycetota bacterium]|nr:lysophospholipase [Actinomycetota bacterium]